MKQTQQHTWRPVTINGVEHQCVQLASQFVLDNRFYAVGSWLVKGPGDVYARAMTDDEFKTAQKEKG